VLWRAKPTATEEEDFETGKRVVKGHARFTVTFGDDDE
jgi:hypothetical protein